MSDKHERFLAQLIDGRVTPGSGNHAANPMDVRGDARRQHYAFALDGKSTMGLSIPVSRAMWTKATEQAHDEYPGLGLRFYDDQTLRRGLDLIVVGAAQFGAMLEELRTWAASR
jgi:hypothetical protein